MLELAKYKEIQSVPAAPRCTCLVWTPLVMGAHKQVAECMQAENDAVRHFEKPPYFNTCFTQVLLPESKLQKRGRRVRARVCALPKPKPTFRAEGALHAEKAVSERISETHPRTLLAVGEDNWRQDSSAFGCSWGAMSQIQLQLSVILQAFGNQMSCVTVQMSCKPMI